MGLFAAIAPSLIAGAFGMIGAKKSQKAYNRSVAPYRELGLRSAMNLEDLMRNVWKPVAYGEKPIPELEKSTAYGKQQIARSGDQAVREARSIGAMTGIHPEGRVARARQQTNRDLLGFTSSAGERELGFRNTIASMLADKQSQLAGIGAGLSQGAGAQSVQSIDSMYGGLGGLVGQWQSQQRYDELLKILLGTGMDPKEARDEAAKAMTPEKIPNTPPSAPSMGASGMFGNAFRDRYGAMPSMPSVGGGLVPQSAGGLSGILSRYNQYVRW